ncbi:MAG: Na+/H+ antiporter subunit E [Rhodocyclaceae bacterium]|nr:Na+/H+ antiporter subunit E [Rhodocyclaceae bacterium]MDZ4215400.1 Na+/H+ antiporter subunit E [Rhodocyclaceae bacterium]
MIRVLWWRGLLFACLWWILAEGRLDGWLLGSIAVVAATWASVALWPPAAHDVRLAALPAFLAFFLTNSVRGGWQVALMALRGRGALQPAFLELPLNLPAGVPQVLMTNVLSLMPGTVGVELVAELTNARLRLHVLHQDLPVVAEARALEQRIAALFGVSA